VHSFEAVYVLLVAYNITKREATFRHLKHKKICYCGGNIVPMTTLTLMLTQQDPDDDKPDPT